MNFTGRMNLTMKELVSKVVKQWPVRLQKSKISNHEPQNRVNYVLWELMGSFEMFYINTFNANIIKIHFCSSVKLTIKNSV